MQACTKVLENAGSGSPKECPKRPLSLGKTVEDLRRRDTDTSGVNPGKRLHLLQMLELKRWRFQGSWSPADSISSPRC